MNDYSWYKDNLPIMNDKIAPGFAELHDLHLLESLYNLPGKPSWLIVSPQPTSRSK